MARGPSPPGKPGEDAATPPGTSRGQRGSGQQASIGGVLRTVILAGAVTVVLVAAVAGSAYLIQRPGRSPASGEFLRPSRIPPSVSAQLASMMALSPVPASRAP